MMNRIMMLVMMMSLGVLSATVLQGPIELKDEVFNTLTVNGDATLHNITVDNLVVNGSLEANNLVASKMRIHGSVTGKSITAKSLEVSGTLRVVQSQIDHVSVLGEAFIRGLKAKVLYLFTQPSVPLYAVRADNVMVKTPEPIELKVGDACYIGSIRFMDAPGKVYVMKDRSYVGDVMQGSLHR